MAEYFSHDYNTREDEKIKNLTFKFGWKGYGFYWGLVESLYQNDGYMQTHYERIAFDMRIEKNILISIINDFDLFIIKDNLFFSKSILHRLKLRKSKSITASKSARVRWDRVKQNNANALQAQSDSNAIKESKEKESKEKESKEILKEKFIYFIKNFNEITGKNFRILNDKLKGQINARLKDGFTIEEMLQATKNCLKDEYHVNNPKYLTPEFITRLSKLERYLNIPDETEKELTLNDFIIPTKDIFGWGDKKCLEMALRGEYKRK